MLRFYSDGSVTERGFRIEYSVYDNPYLYTTPPPSTDGRCNDISGTYRASDGSADLIVNADKDPDDTKFEATGLFRNNTDLIPGFLQFMGLYDPRPFNQLLSFNAFLGNRIWKMSGVCKECSDGKKQLEMFETLVNVEHPDCGYNNYARPTTPIVFEETHLTKDEMLESEVPEKN